MISLLETTEYTKPTHHIFKDLKVSLSANADLRERLNGLKRRLPASAEGETVALTDRMAEPRRGGVGTGVYGARYPTCSG